MTDELSARAAVIRHARGWIGTPYHHRGRVKGAGVDCAMLLAEIYAEAGLAPPLAIPPYPPDWHLHRDSERYLATLLEYCVEIAPDFASHHGHAKDSGAACATRRPVLPGDIALWKFGRCFSHGAVVVLWPQVIHAYLGCGCVLEDASKAMWLTRMGEAGARPRPVKFFTLKRWTR